METNSDLQNFILFLGPYKWPLAILALVVLVLVITKAYQYFLLRNPLAKGLNAILFWGIVAAAVGLTGQINGIWLSLSAIISADDISPPMVLIGFLSTFNTTLSGLVIGLFAALAWWALRSRLHSLQKQNIH